MGDSVKAEAHSSRATAEEGRSINVRLRVSAKIFEKKSLCYWS